jgi:hypothetical protein
MLDEGKQASPIVPVLDCLPIRSLWALTAQTTAQDTTFVLVTCGTSVADRAGIRMFAHT